MVEIYKLPIGHSRGVSVASIRFRYPLTSVTASVGMMVGVPTGEYRGTVVSMSIGPPASLAMWSSWVPRG